MSSPIHPLLLRPQRLPNNRLFWENYPGLVWSNPQADDSAYICAALLKPHFTIILGLCAEFGLERVETEWHSLLREGEMGKVNRAKPLVERILGNIKTGFEDATRRNKFETQRASDVGLERIRNAITKRTLPGSPD